VWRELMTLLHADHPSVAPKPPPGVVRAAVSFAKGVETPREEWFLAGTEPGAAAQALAPRQPRIRTPQGGEVIALDPDIPSALQRLSFEAVGIAAGDGAKVRWLLDGRDLAPASGHLLWALEPGRHRLALVAGDGHTFDAVAFEVRGGAPDMAAP
jgi:penicillin-binding protein 1C